MKKGDWAALAGVASVLGLGVTVMVRRQRGVADRPFLEQAARNGQCTLTLARLALDRTHNDEVRAFAEMILEDHGEANRQLRGLARRLGVRLPRGLDQRAQEAQERLSAMTGTPFDRALLDTMSSDHIRAIAIFNSERNNGTDPAIRQFASHMVPTLQEHLSVARALAAHIGRTTTKRH